MEDGNQVEKKSPRKLHVWLIGNNERPATEEDIQEFIKGLEKAQEPGDEPVHIVSHHAVQYFSVCLEEDCCPSCGHKKSNHCVTSTTLDKRFNPPSCEG